MNRGSCCVEDRCGRFISDKCGRVKTTAEWAAPALVLLLLPKCPMCIATYVLLFTGVGLSLQAVVWLRGAIFVVCVAAITTLAMRLLYRKVAMNT